MMQDQHKDTLVNYYRKDIENTVNYLKTKYSLIVCKKDDEDVPEEILDKDSFNFYKIEIFSTIKNYTIILAIPDSFPDNFPKIYLSKNDFQEIYPIPHLNKNRFICTRDPEVVVLSDKTPEIATEELINISLDIIEKGLKSENQDDFIKEFLAYWNEQKSYTFLSIFDPLKECRILFLYELSNAIFNCNCILSDSEEELTKWLTPFGISKKIVLEALYIPVIPFNPYYLNKNYEILEILKDCPEDNIRRLGNYFNQNPFNNIIVSSFLINNEKIFFGWCHERLKNEKFKGFRNNNVPLRVRLLTPQYKNLPIKKIEIKRLDKERIYKRGGARTDILEKEMKLILFGVGSIGSFLVMSLSRIGISQFTLVDKDTLNPENTPRHLCGFLEASQGMKKVDAVKKRIIEHFPYIRCIVHNNDILELLKDNKLDFTDCNLLIVAVANYALERRINYLQKKGEINCPILYIWMEPFGVGGQVIYIDSKNEGCFECCFDNEGNFNYAVTRKEDIFQKQESGCQSTFLPYSSISIEQFIVVAVKIIINILQKTYQENMSFTWTGNIEEFESLGYRINYNYAAKSSYSLIKRKILKSELCNLCVKKE